MFTTNANLEAAGEINLSDSDSNAVDDVKLGDTQLAMVEKEPLEGCSKQNHLGEKFVPFQYYATTGENSDESNQLNSEADNSSWDQKMDEA